MIEPPADHFAWALDYLADAGCVGDDAAPVAALIASLMEVV
jgi:hypothetical protein